MLRMHAIITTTGPDRTGIIAGVAQAAAEHGLNIFDVSQTLMDRFFTMIMRVEMRVDSSEIAALQAALTEVGSRMGGDIRVQTEEQFTAMNEI